MEGSNEVSARGSAIEDHCPQPTLAETSSLSLTTEDAMAFKIGKGVRQLPFDEVLSASFTELLVELVEAGALVSIGAARDKGALSCTVTCGGEWDREWFRSEEELLDWLREAVVVVKALPVEPSTRSRRLRAV